MMRIQVREDALGDQFESLDVVALQRVQHESADGRHMARGRFREEGEPLVREVRESEPGIARSAATGDSRSA
jgi:hypothetical protein